MTLPMEIEAGSGSTTVGDGTQPTTPLVPGFELQVLGALQHMTATLQELHKRMFPCRICSIHMCIIPAVRLDVLIYILQIHAQSTMRCMTDAPIPGVAILALNRQLLTIPLALLGNLTWTHIRVLITRLLQRLLMRRLLLSPLIM